MIFHSLLLFISLTSAFAINTTSSAFRLANTHCGPPQPIRRNNPRPLDCLGAITFILSTVPNRSATVEFSTNPTLGQFRLPYGHNIGNCIAYVVPAQRSQTAPIKSSFDEIVRSMLLVLAQCLLNNQPEQWNWGGGVLTGTGNGLQVGLQGTQKGAIEDRIGNETLGLKGLSSWTESFMLS